MNLPEAFASYSRLFHQDLLKIYPSLDDAVRQAPNFLTRDQVESLKTYLDELTSGRYSNAELQEIWNSSKAQLYISGGSMIEFFRKARAYLN
ncbi:hypothetical protein EDE12_102113 [Methylosinus sp. sav-2]|nr:hypothetical protein EDE12_102113 [Methylosinus sp. sav-2]